MSDKSEDDPRKSEESGVKHNEKFNLRVQTEKEETQVFENAPPEKKQTERRCVVRKKALVN